MNRPWMPMYWRDYLCDTGHLTLEQHGAYLLLIGYYWTHGNLPENDEIMARILRVSRKQLPSIWLAIAPFFDENKRHKRIDAELEKHRTISEKRALSGRLGGLLSHARDNNERFMLRNLNRANAKQTGYQPQPHKDSSSTNSESETGGEQSAERTGAAGSLATALPSGALARQPSPDRRKKEVGEKKFPVTSELERIMQAKLRRANGET